MDCEKGPPSVIEMLMGFNTQSLQQPNLKRQRVLSENYLQKTASLNFSPKRLPCKRPSSRVPQVVVDSDLMDTTEGPTAPYMEQSPYTECHISVDVIRSRPCPKYPNSYKPLRIKEVYRKYGQWSDSMLSNHFQNFQGNSGKSRHIREMKPTSPSEFQWKKKAINSPEIKMKWSSLKLQQIQNRGHILNEPSEMRFGFDLSKQLVKYRGQEKKKISLSLSGISNNEPESEKDPNYSTDFSPYNRKGEDLCSPEGSLMKMHISRILPQGCQDANRSLMPKDTVKSTKVEQPPAIQTSSNTGIQLEHGHHQSHPSVSAMDLEFCASNDTHQETTDSFSETSSVSCPTPEPLSPTSSEGISHRSPISVLDSQLKEIIPSNMDCFMIMNANSNHDGPEYAERYSEEHGMTVSSDEENGEESTKSIQDNAEFSNFSYLANLMNEVCIGFDMNLRIWHSSESPIDPRVFDSLEKKIYSRQVSRLRSERKLLFDRINLGLKDIIKACTGMNQILMPVSRRLGSRWTRQGIEEELHLLVVSQDKEAKRAKILNPSKRKAKKSKYLNALKNKTSADEFKCSDLEDYMDEIVIEIEQSLIKELVVEFADA